jgi:hypothetical protein
MDTEKTFILELLIDAGFVSQIGPVTFQVMTSFGPFKTGTIRTLKSRGVEKHTRALDNPPQRRKRF